MDSIDTHFHLWDLSHGKHTWLRSDPSSDLNANSPGQIRLAELRKSYLVGDFLRDIAGQHVVKGVHVEGKYDETDPVAETAWLQSVADEPTSRGFPHAIVAFANLADLGFQRVLEAHAAFANFRGIRQILNQPTRPDEPEYLDDPQWGENYGLLRRFNASFDMQIYHGQIQAAGRLARRYPDIPIVLNHAGMPAATAGEAYEAWRKSMTQLAESDNVTVKISGLGMTIPDVNDETARPIVEATIDAFGTDRVMFGSNFPVDGLHSPFDALWTMFDRLSQSYSDGERQALFHDNAVRVYRL